MKRLSRSWSENEHIGRLPAYLLMDWEQMCGRLGLDFALHQSSIDEGFTRILRNYLWRPETLVDIYRITQETATAKEAGGKNKFMETIDMNPAVLPPKMSFVDQEFSQKSPRSGKKRSINLIG